VIKMVWLAAHRWYRVFNPHYLIEPFRPTRHGRHLSIWRTSGCRKTVPEPLYEFKFRYL